MSLFLIVQGFQNKRFVRDYLIDVDDLGKRFHLHFKIVELVFNHNALNMNDAGKAAYFMRLNHKAEKRVLQISLQESLIDNGECEESYRFVNIKDEEYQNLFLGWHGFMF